MTSPTSKWMQTVDESLKEGREQFRDLAKKLDDNAKTTKEVVTKLDVNTAATKAIASKLDDHVDSYEKFRTSTQPAIDAIITMQSGVRAIGKIANFFGWLAQRIRKGIVWIAPIFAFFAGLWAFFHDNAAAMWNSMWEFFK